LTVVSINVAVNDVACHMNILVCF